MILNGTREQRDAWHRDRGHDVGLFIHKLIKKENIPPISADRKTGGIMLLGWSAGAGDANATIAHADTLQSDVRSHLALYIRSLIIQGVSYHLSLRLACVKGDFVRFAPGHVWRFACPK